MSTEKRMSNWLEQWQQLTKASLSIKDKQLFKEELARFLGHHSTIQTAILLGAQSDSTGSAFLSGYQSALRCIKVPLAANQWAALVVSEKGIKNPKQMKSRLRADKGKLLIDGEKSYAMLLGQGLDQLIVIVKDEQEQLVSLLLDANQNAIEVVESSVTKYFPDIPHASLRFNQLAVADSDILSSNAHHEINKPFRYWEDMHVSVALLSWAAKRVDDAAVLLEHIDDLEQSFQSSPDYYQLEIIEKIDQTLELIDRASEYFDSVDKDAWMRDRDMFLFGKNIRSLISSRLKQ